MECRGRVLQLLTEEYDKWAEEEQKNIDNGCGMRGSNGDLGEYSTSDLFNEIVWRLSKNINKEILEKLQKLQSLGVVFNQQVGYLYSSITADEINKVMDDLRENYDIEIKFYQPMPGRIDLSYVDRLIERMG